MGELGAERIRPAGKRQHGVVAVPPHHRWQLEEIANQHDLQAAERRLLSPDMAADRIDQAQGACRQHRDLIDDEHLGLLDAGGEAAVGREQVEIASGERLAHADAAPGMDGDAVPVRRGDAGRGGVGIVDALPLELADIAVDRVGLAAAWLAGEKDARAGPEQGKRLVLGHAITTLS